MRIAVVLGVLLVLVIGAGVVWYLRASGGEEAGKLEQSYVTSTDRFVEVDGARLRVREQGPADAPVLLLLHGFTFSLETWDGWAERLSEDYRVIRYDLLGHGLTGPDPRERYAPKERAAFVGEVLDALGVDHAIIGGNSLGGLAAWRFAAQAPERVDALLLVSPGAYPMNGVDENPAEVPAAMALFLRTVPEAGVRATLERLYGDPERITEERVKLMGDMMRREGNGDAMIRSIEKFTLPDPDADLATVTAPTLLLWGEADQLIPMANGEKLAEVIPNAKLVTYPGAGHIAQEEIPEETAADAAAFLRDVGLETEE